MSIRLFTAFSVAAIAAACVAAAGCAASDSRSGRGDSDDAPGEAEEIDEVESPGEEFDDRQADGETEEAADGAEEEETWSPFRFVVISDTHLMPNNQADNNQRFMRAGAVFSDPGASYDFVVSTGDNVEDLLCLPDISCTDPLPILTTYRGLIEEYVTIAFYIVMGNHDDRYFDSFLDLDTPWNSWKAVFPEPDHLPARYYEVEHKGFSFLMLFSMDLAFDHASNDLASFGEEQLAWLDERLDRGGPSVVFWHHYLRPATTTDNAAFLAVLKKHRDTVKATFAGHEHMWDVVEWEGIPFYQTMNLGKNDRMPYYSVECDPSTGSVVVERNETPDPVAEQGP